MSETNKNKDRHRPGYWKKRWAKQKAAKAAAEANNPKPKKKKKVRKDRHRPGYYHDYNQKHPERLNRGFTKGYVNGNVSEGPKVKHREEIAPGVYILGWDEFGFPITNNPFGDLLRHKEAQWHDDDWEEGSWDD